MARPCIELRCSLNSVGKWHKRRTESCVCGCRLDGARRNYEFGLRLLRWRTLVNSRGNEALWISGLTLLD